MLLRICHTLLHFLEQLLVDLDARFIIRSPPTTIEPLILVVAPRTTYTLLMVRLFRHSMSLRKGLFMSHATFNARVHETQPSQISQHEHNKPTLKKVTRLTNGYL